MSWVQQKVTCEQIALAFAKVLAARCRRAHLLTSAELRRGAAADGQVAVSANVGKTLKLALLQDPAEDRSFHTVVTADGTATHWQSRVGYYHFLKVKRACEARGHCQMVGAAPSRQP